MNLEFHGTLTQTDWLYEWFGSLGRELGNPARFFTDNPNILVEFVKKCAEEKTPCFMSVNSYSAYDRPCGIEKLFFEFDIAKEDEVKKREEEGKPITEEEMKQRKVEMEFELKTWLSKLSFDGRNIAPLVCKTRRGYHVYIFLSKVFTFEPKHFEFAKKVYKKLCDRFTNMMDLKYVDDHNSNIKQLARVPTSIHQKSGEVCIIVDNNLVQTKIRGLNYFRLYGIIPVEVARIIDLLKKEEKLKKAKEEQLKAEMPKSRGWVQVRQGKIRPCFEKALDVGEACHQQRLALLLEAYCSSIITVEGMMELFSRFHDYDENIPNSKHICRTQVGWFFERQVKPLLDAGKEVKPYKCSTIFKHGWCLKEECPIYKGGGKKPVGYKPFDPVSYEKNRWVEDFLLTKINIPDFVIQKNSDKHGIDINVWKDGKMIGGIEAEWHGRHWKDKFLFETVHCLGRKFKYAQPHCFYVMVNEDGSQVLMIPFDIVIASKMISLNNAYCDKEVYFDVPVEKCVWGWTRINEYLSNYFHQMMKVGKP